MAIQSSALVYETAQERSWLKETAIVLGASVIIALFAPVSIPLPFSPVPLATQMNVILLLSCFLGGKRAALAVLAFLFQGAIGLPVYAGGVGGGLLKLAGPTGGYLLGYVVAAFVTGYLFQRKENRSSMHALTAMGIGNLVVYLFGISWLSRFVGWQSAVVMGVLPFLIGDALKLVVATRLLKQKRRFIA